MHCNCWSLVTFWDFLFLVLKQSFLAIFEAKLVILGRKYAIAQLKPDLDSLLYCNYWWIMQKNCCSLWYDWDFWNCVDGPPFWGTVHRLHSPSLRSGWAHRQAHRWFQHSLSQAWTVGPVTPPDRRCSNTRSGNQGRIFSLFLRVCRLMRSKRNLIILRLIRKIRSTKKRSKVTADP